MIRVSSFVELSLIHILLIVEKILPVVLAMIGAPSKYYKSYMALGLCVAICNGGKFLDFDCHKHSCLYLDLESTKRRHKSRLNQILGPFGRKPDNLNIIKGTDEPGRIGDGFENQIEYQLQEHPEIKVIVVDVFQMIRQPAKKNQTGYDRDYDDFKVLKRIADRYNIGLMLIHHTRKMRDPSDAVSYTHLAQMNKQAMRTLRQRVHRYQYKQYYDQYLAAAPIRHVGLESFKRTWYSAVEREVLGRCV